MLEAGISLIATNLPSLYFLVKETSLHTLAARIRTAISLARARTGRSKVRMTDPSAYFRMQANGSVASDVPVMKREKEYGEGQEGTNTFARYDVENEIGVRRPGVIHVRDEIRLEDYRI